MALVALTAGLSTLTIGANPAAASPAPITIAYVTSVTGPGGPEDGSSPAGKVSTIV